jgi:protein-S-isoprenylcysteine O-methyltransferase Ste14
MIAGSLLRRHCFRVLGKSFTGDVRASADQQVVSSGAYSILRHPSYTAAIILNSGLALALGSWASLVVLMVVSLVVYSYRISVEERVLLTTIGEPYRQFMNSRKRLIPFVY